MNLETRMRQSISRRSGSIVLRSDVVGLGSPTQVSHVLDSLINKGFIYRLGRGIYVKASFIDSSTAKLSNTLSTVITDTAEKLGFSLKTSLSLESNDLKAGKTIKIETKNSRVSRSININGIRILFGGGPSSTKSRKANKLVQFPTKNVAKYIENLANANKVKYKHHSMDLWANTVTRLAGDEVRQDTVEDLLIAMKRAGKITSKEVAILTVNYLRERNQSVRSV